MGPNMMLPLLLMDDKSDNQNLMFMMMMSENKAPNCGPVQPAQRVQPAQPVQTVYRTWRINEDGTKTLVEES